MAHRLFKSMAFVFALCATSAAFAQVDCQTIFGPSEVIGGGGPALRPIKAREQVLLDQDFHVAAVSVHDLTKEGYYVALTSRFDVLLGRPEVNGPLIGKLWKRWLEGINSTAFFVFGQVPRYIDVPKTKLMHWVPDMLEWTIAYAVKNEPAMTTSMGYSPVVDLRETISAVLSDVSKEHLRRLGYSEQAITEIRSWYQAAQAKLAAAPIN